MASQYYQNALREAASGELEHHGILGQKWGIRRFQNSDGSLTARGRERYGVDSNNSLLKKDYLQEAAKQRAIRRNNANTAAAMLVTYMIGKRQQQAEEENRRQTRESDARNVSKAYESKNFDELFKKSENQKAVQKLKKLTDEIKKDIEKFNAEHNTKFKSPYDFMSSEKNKSNKKMNAKTNDLWMMFGKTIGINDAHNIPQYGAGPDTKRNYAEDFNRLFEQYLAETFK